MQSSGTPDLLERGRELRVLADLVAAARARRGRLALVEWPPGLGKTRLLDAAREEARRHGLTVLSARASELDRDFPLGVARQLYEPLLGDEELLRGAAAPAAALLGHGAPEADAPAQLHALYWLTANLAERAP